MRLAYGRDTGLRWFESSPQVYRGFRGACRSSLFRTRAGSEGIRIMAGSLDAPIRLRLIRHIHTAEAGDYYCIDPDLPRHERWALPPEIPDEAPEEEES